MRTQVTIIIALINLQSNKFLNRIMVQSSMQAISEADVILVMIDGTKKFSEDDLNLFDKIKD